MEEEFVKNPEGEFYLGAFHEAIFLIAAAAAAPALSLSLSLQNPVILTGYSYQYSLKVDVLSM